MLKMGDITIHDNNDTEVTAEIADEIKKEYQKLEENKEKEMPSLKIKDEKKE